MHYRKTLPAITRRLLADTRGSFSMMWAVAVTGILVSVGATYDLSQLTKAKAIAQYTADNMALSASVSVDLNNSDRYEAYPVVYDFSDIGAPDADFTDSMQGSVEFDIVDSVDNEKLLARATVTGVYMPTFISFIPRFTAINFIATSDVAYAGREGTPASIFFTVDNSGSMNNYDANNEKKIDSLKTSLANFMTTLDGINNYGDNIFRTALFPYNYDIISNMVVDPDWSTLSDYDIDRMYGHYGTQSTNALARARTKFDLENQIHFDINGESAPLKFLVFMSDGANNGSTEQCAPGQTPEHWIDTYNGWNTVYYDYQSWFDQWVIHYATECAIVSPVNDASLVQCTAMKTSGVKIYSIAYDVDPSERALAEDFMKKCSSNYDSATQIYTNNGFYNYATSGTDLKNVFDEIGNAVVTEVIRVKH